MKKLFSLFFAFIMVLSFSSCSSLIAPEVEPRVGPFTEFGDIRPEINLNGKKYYYGEYFKTGYIPEGYSEAGYSVFVGAPGCSRASWRTSPRRQRPTGAWCCAATALSTWMTRPPPNGPPLHRPNLQLWHS